MIRRQVRLMAGLLAFAQLGPVCAKDGPATPMSLSINENVAIADLPVMGTPGELWSFAIRTHVLGPKGAAAAGGAPKSQESQEQQFKVFLEDSGVDVREIVRASFLEQLATHPAYSLADSDNHGELRLAVKLYGINAAGPFSTQLEPVLTVRASLYRPDGKMAWTWAESERFPSARDVTPHTLEEYVGDPQLLKDGYKKLSDLVAVSLLNRLAKAKGVRTAQK